MVSSGATGSDQRASPMTTMLARDRQRVGRPSDTATPQPPRRAFEYAPAHGESGEALEGLVSFCTSNATRQRPLIITSAPMPPRQGWPDRLRLGLRACWPGSAETPSAIGLCRAAGWPGLARCASTSGCPTTSRCCRSMTSTTTSPSKSPQNSRSVPPVSVWSTKTARSSSLKHCETAIRFPSPACPIADRPAVHACCMRRH